MIASLLAGCGGAGVAAPDARCVGAVEAAAALPDGSVNAGAAIAVAAHDDHFAPACVETPTGGELTLVVRNVGSHPHDLTLPSGDGVTVDAGQVAFLDAVVGPDGLRYVCTIHPGMEGQILVAG